ncbi:Mur ligase family protein [Sporosarcina sp. BI001-red]|uniref:Mur ligase family protein n=1 Tax=Sporosarcina sp. BI001-red TaxID=2282866 RepID=UPI001313F37B|nr:UDP-N-acetylmuramoyl-L-alanyl-D-glutamate--2,6-diaminopimelate ligase [Sporosarcina sp. BI001-red]
MHLIELLKDWPCTIQGNWRDVTIDSVTEHPNRLKKNCLFIARKGAHHDGMESIEEALDRGAAAIVIDRSVPECNLSKWSQRGVAIVTVPDCKRFLSYSSAQLSGDPSEELTIIAVTGTNGKTTVTHFISQLLSQFGIKTAVLGTTGCYIDGEKFDEEMPPLTTPTAEYLHPLLRKCKDRGVTHVALEASSLGLEMGRLAHCHVSIGVFLNIGVDHFEEHGGREHYIAAKKRLCSLSEQLVVNCEDVECMHIVKDIELPIHLFGRNIAGGCMPSEELIGSLPPGEHNRLNAMAAATVVKLLGFPEREIFTAFRLLTLPEGRMQLVEHEGRRVYIDYAHTPDALSAALQAVTSLNPRKLICVFGCGGDRDKEKRPVMGKIAENYCDTVVLTSDNPRSEHPLAIVQHILKGTADPTSICVVMDRKRAIHQAIAASQPNDIVLIAGKGHETSQIIGSEEIRMSDLAEAMTALHQLETFQE